MSDKFQWKKILTREYTFLFASYASDALKIMRKVVGTTLRHDLFYGEGKLLTIYRVERDIQNSYKMIEKIAKRDPKEIIRKMDTFDELIKKDYELFSVIKKCNDKKQIKRHLLDLDKTFLLTLCHYLFFVYLGYAGNLSSAAKFLKKHGKRFKRIRTYTIDTDMNKQFPVFFGKYNRKLLYITSYMSRKELITFVCGRKVNMSRILKRKKRYLVIMKNHGVKEYEYSQINFVLQRELSYLQKQKTTNFLQGQIACRGKTRGTAKVIFTEKDYKKIQKGDIVITPMTKPTIVPFLKKVKGIVTNDGGALSHASIISREMKIPCIVGTIYATDIFKDGDIIEVDADKGVVTKI